MVEKHILLVDDDAGHAYLAMRRIQKSGEFTIEWVSSGNEALQMLNQLLSSGKLPDLILLDLNMPGLTGFDVMERLNADEKLKEIPRFIVSTSDEPEDFLKAKVYGYTGYIVKPIDYVQLGMKIRQLFEGD